MLYAQACDAFLRHMAGCMEDIVRNNEIAQTINRKLFNKVIFLDEKVKGKVKQVINI